MTDEPLAEETQKAKAQFDELTAIRKIINIFEKFDEGAQYRIQSYVQHYLNELELARNNGKQPGYFSTFVDNGIANCDVAQDEVLVLRGSADNDRG